MLSNVSPFHGDSDYLTMEKVTHCEYEIPSGMPSLPKDLIEQLLVCEGSKRLGSIETGGYDALKHHPWFSAVSWESLPLTVCIHLLS